MLEVRAAIAIRRAEAEIKRFNPDQPRAPKGRPDGGQWIDGDADVAMSKKLTEDEAGRSMTRTPFIAEWWACGVATLRPPFDTVIA